MLKFLVISAVVIGIVAVCVLVLAAAKPPRFSIQRSIMIQAPREKVFALINDLHRWPEWSADGREDSPVRRSYSGPPEGKGAIYEWEGAGSSGKGRIEIVESSPGQIRLQADWDKPFRARNINIFILEPQAGATRVTWALDGENVFVLRVMTVFVSIDQIMGSHFEKGLTSLKALAEK